MKFKGIVIALFILAVKSCALAQQASKYEDGEDIRFSHLNVKDGLPNNIANCMLQDSSGYLWFGTGGGLSRYDGNSLTTFLHAENDSSSICNSRINCLYEDKLHNIWVGTYFGLAKFDPVKMNFKNYYFDKGSSKVGSNIVTNIIQDNKGTLLVSTNAGIYKCDPVKVEFSLVKSFTEDHYGYLIHGMASISGSRIFILMDTALLYSDDNCKSFKTAVSSFKVTKGFFTELYFDYTDGKLWFGEYSHPNVYEFNIKTFETKKHTLDTTDVGFPKYLAWDFCRLNDSTMMVGCLLGRLGGAFVFLNTKRNTYHDYTHSKADASSLSNGDVWCILKDRQNSIWIGTDLGINSFNLRQLNFQWLSTDKWGVPGFEELNIRQLCYDNNLWIGTVGAGLFEYNPVDHHFSHFGRPYSTPKKHRDEIFSIYPYKDTLWIGGSLGFIRFNINTRTFDTARKPVPELKELYFDTPKGIGRDNEGTFWFGTFSRGIFSYNPATGKGAHYLERDSNLITKHMNIMRCLCMDALGNKWVGTYEDGFYCMEAGTNQIIWNIPGDKNAVVMQRGWINDIYCDKLGNTYIATVRSKYDYWNI